MTAAVGGLAGGNGGVITSSYATDSVSAAVEFGSAGGLVGGSSATSRTAISTSYATGSVTGYTGGGLVGSNYHGSGSGSYATGSVSAGQIGSGLVGWNNGSSISASYATGSVSHDPDIYSTSEAYPISLGGLVGKNGAGATVTDSYWNKKTSGLTSSAGGVGKGTVAMKRPTGYTGLYANWNVDVDGDDIPDDPWFFGTHSQLPVLQYGFLGDVDQRPVLRRRR